jgi:asparagine synthase (glutamine-hydrolysing)
MLTVRDGEVRVRRWWELNLSNVRPPDSYGADGDQGCVDELGRVLIDATRLRLRSDVPVGAYLSGGLDSSLLAALVNRYTKSRLETFSIAFSDSEFDESSYQMQVASHLGTRHHTVRCSHEDIGNAFPEVVWHAEKTLLRTAPVPMYLLSKYVHQSGFKVIVTGEGADEMLGGYDIFKETKIRSFWAKQPASRLRPLLLRRLYPYMQQMQNQSPEYLEKFFRIRPEDLISPFYSHLPRWEMTRRLELLFSKPFASEFRERKAWEVLDWRFPAQYESWDAFQRAQYLEASYLLPGYILSSQGDRPAMANAVEGRFPFLDPRVVEFACGLPSSLKMRGLDVKYLLKRFAAPLLPPNVVRRPKQPYRAPEVKSFLDTEKGTVRHEYAAEMLSPGAVRRYGIFHETAVQTLVKKLLKQPSCATVRDSMAITGVISTQLLMHQFIHTQGSRGKHGRNSSETSCVYYR